MAAMAMAAASTPVMAQQAALHLGVQGDRTVGGSMVHLRRGVAAGKPVLWQGAAGARGFGFRSSVVVAAGGEVGGEEEESKEIKIAGEDDETETEIEIAGVLGEGEEVAALLEPPVDSIDEAYVEALNDGTLSDAGTLPDAGSEEQYEDGDGDEELEDVKQQLIDSLYGTQRGLRASSDTRAEIVELITQLEAKNPTPAPTEALNLLDGKWILAYTSYSELYPLLAAGNLPLVTVGEISQTINAQALTLDNTVSFEGPLTTTSFSASASFEIRSPKRVQVKFEEGVIGSPKVPDSVEVPSSVDIFGQKIDLTPARGLLQPLQEIATRVARTLSGAPPLKFSIQTDRAQSWLLTTFLDEDIRISRGDGGSVFVLLRVGSTLLY
ncbi:hypothetical protein M758_7G136200 [Ceratodon purpureus]|nr:hypothetical protein M758_7G136200 [Ceratodon purpureus]